LVGYGNRNMERINFRALWQGADADQVFRQGYGFLTQRLSENLFALS
jgi:hypothetical protein